MSAEGSTLNLTAEQQAELETLKAQILEVGGKIRELKTKGDDPDGVKALVEELTKLKVRHSRGALPRAARVLWRLCACCACARGRGRGGGRVRRGARSGRFRDGL